jgi:hypothetical protein
MKPVRGLLSALALSSPLLAEESNGTRWTNWSTNCPEIDAYSRFWNFSASKANLSR